MLYPNLANTTSSKIIIQIITLGIQKCGRLTNFLILIKFACIQSILSVGEEFINLYLLYRNFFAIIPYFCTFFWIGVGLRYSSSLYLQQRCLVRCFMEVVVARSMGLGLLWIIICFYYFLRLDKKEREKYYCIDLLKKTKNYKSELNQLILQQKIPKRNSMGPPPPPRPPSQIGQPQPKIDQLNLIAQLKILLIEILKEFKNQGEDVSIFEEQMRSRDPHMKRGENFQARLDQKGDIIGIAKIFNHDNDKCSIYIGEITNKKPSGRGINIKVPLITNQKQKTYTVGRTTYQAHLMQSWENKDNLMKGCLFKKKNNTTQFFKGQFLKQKIHRGRLTLKENQIVKMMYIGEFKNSLINGRGTLIIPGKSKYTGEFQNGNKQGIGQQEDQLRNTYYVGQFQANYRHGYGELTYKNRDNVKLKGFWNDGVMKPDEGVYVNKDGIFLEKFGNDVHLI